MCRECGKFNCYCFEKKEGKRVYNDYQRWCKERGLNPIEHHLKGMFEEMALKARVDICHKAGKLFLI